MGRDATPRRPLSVESSEVTSELSAADVSARPSLPKSQKVMRASISVTLPSSKAEG